LNITRIDIENFKRIYALSVEVSPTGDLIEICGDNGVGKSSTIDSIFATLCGAKASPERPIREGQHRAVTSVEIGELKVTRRWSQGRGTSLVVTNREGYPVSSPQTLLDKLYESLTFDPLAFMGMDSKKQADVLRRIVGLDFSDLDQRRKQLYEERTEVGRSIKLQESRLAEIPHDPQVATQGEEGIKELMGRLTAIQASNRQHSATKAKLDGLNLDRDRVAREIGRLHAELERIIKDVTDTEWILSKSEPQDTSQLVERIQGAESHNRIVRSTKEWQTLAAEIEANRRHYEDLDTGIYEVDEEQKRRIAKAQFPLSGLSIIDDLITIEGIPLEQASTSQKILTCLSISAALKPEIRVILIREGSMLDRRNLALVAEWAKGNNYQVFMERVADGIQGTGLIIEDGRVVEAQGGIRNVLSQDNRDEPATQEEREKEGGMVQSQPRAVSEASRPEGGVSDGPDGFNLDI
jgi:hypothetical protein